MLRRLGRRGLRLIRADDPETGWLVRIVLTGLQIWSLVFYPGVHSTFVRPALLVSFACWVFWMVADQRFPVPARAALAAAALLPAAVAALPHNGAAHLFLYGSLFTFVLLPRMPLWAILWLTGALIVVLSAGLSLAGHGPTALLTQPALVLLVVLFSLHRREYRLRGEQILRTREAQARAAALDERARIARELHDVLAHSLGALGVQLEVAEAQLTERGDVEAAAERVRRARRLAADGMTEARSAVAALRSDVVPLARALDDLIAVHKENFAATVTLQVIGTPRALPSGAEVSLQRTTREALTNAARHAPGAPVTITLEYAPAKVRLTLTNPTTNAQTRTGYGLIGARERLALVDGTLDAGVVDGVWRVTAEVPG
ncbi:histidine kinase [Actinoplanes sp. Pm04-4]|uniref:histidine kinase n=1 Tax=Paractinoplanes pyxinae TaxID=2997416 RepID=A0ABT4BGU4_9ACTN|nr:histidine kinase [Actinoplanes pyxinae]MCY1145749.1 histidine kinase [Actinoplanes pyxinae]